MVAKGKTWGKKKGRDLAAGFSVTYFLLRKWLLSMDAYVWSGVWIPLLIKKQKTSASNLRKDI